MIPRFFANQENSPKLGKVFERTLEEPNDLFWAKKNYHFSYLNLDHTGCEIARITQKGSDLIPYHNHNFVPSETFCIKMNLWAIPRNFRFHHIALKCVFDP